MASALGIRVATCVMGILFIMPGLIKVVRFNSSLTKEMLKNFKNFTEVMPLKYAGVKVQPRTYMEVTGVLELILGTTLLVGTNLSKKVATLGLMIMMLGALYTLFALNDINGMIVPGGYLGLLVWVYASITRAEDKVKRD